MKKSLDTPKTAFITQDTFDKIAKAIQDILDGECSKVIISDDVKVYKCTNIIRIDLKTSEVK